MCVKLRGLDEGSFGLGLWQPTKLHKGVSPKVTMIYTCRELGRESSLARRGIIRLVEFSLRFWL